MSDHLLWRLFWPHNCKTHQSGLSCASALASPPAGALGGEAQHLASSPLPLVLRFSVETRRREAAGALTPSCISAQSPVSRERPVLAGLQLWGDAALACSSWCLMVH